MLFFVTRIDAQGKKSFGLEVQNDIDLLITSLEKSGFIVLDLFQLPGFLSPLAELFSRGKVKREEVIEVLKNLHTIIKSGIPLFEGLKDLAKDAQSRYLRRALIAISADVGSGNSLSSSIQKYEKEFTPMIVNLIRIGEETGGLEETTRRGAEFLEKIENLKKKTKQALIYPSFALTAILGAMLVWLLYVLPKIVESFRSMDIELPWITKAVIAFSEFLSNYFLLIAVVVFVAVFFVVFLIKKSKKARWRFHWLLIKIPIIGIIIRYFNIAFLSEYLRLSIASGLPAYDSLKTVGEAIGNEVYKENIAKSIESIASGIGLSKGLESAGLYTPFAVRMIAVGEQTGDLDVQLGNISDFYYTKVDYIAENISKIIEPVVIITLGLFMAVIMVALFGPVYDMMTKMQFL